MMHICPECGMACSCSGDIEDHDTGDEFYVECSHDCMEDDDEDDGPKQQASPELRQVLADALANRFSTGQEE